MDIVGRDSTDDLETAAEEAFQLWMEKGSFTREEVENPAVNGTFGVGIASGADGW